MDSPYFSYKTRGAHGGRVRLFQPLHLSGVPRGLDPGESEVLRSVGPFLIHFYLQKPAPETRERKKNLSEQKNFPFKPRQPTNFHKAARAAPPLSGRHDRLSVAPVKITVCTPGPGDPGACSLRSASKPQDMQNFPEGLTCHHEVLLPVETQSSGPGCSMALASGHAALLPRHPSLLY